MSELNKTVAVLDIKPIITVKEEDVLKVILTEETPSPEAKLDTPKGPQKAKIIQQGKKIQPSKAEVFLRKMRDQLKFELGIVENHQLTGNYISKEMVEDAKFWKTCSDTALNEKRDEVMDKTSNRIVLLLASLKSRVGLGRRQKLLQEAIDFALKKKDDSFYQTDLDVTAAMSAMATAGKAILGTGNNLSDGFDAVKAADDDLVAQIRAHCKDCGIKLSTSKHRKCTWCHDAAKASTSSYKSRGRGNGKSTPKMGRQKPAKPVQNNQGGEREQKAS